MTAVGWVDIKEPHTGKLLLKFHPLRDIIEVQRRGVKTVIDLTSYRDCDAEPAGRPTIHGNGTPVDIAR